MKNTLLRICVFAFAILNVIYYFFPWRIFFYPAIALLLYILIVSPFSLSKSGRAVVLGLFAVAIALMIYAGATPLQWMKGLLKNGLLIALFTCGPLLHLPFTYEDYQSELINVAKLYMHSLIPFCFLIAIPTHIFAALTGFAAFAIMYHLFLNTSKLYNAEDIFVSTLGRSYSTSGFWGTSWASVMLVVSELGVAWHKLILVGLVFTAVSIAINLGSVKIKLLRDPTRYPSPMPDKDTVVHWKYIRMMALLAVAIVLVTLFVNRATGWNLLAIVPLVGLVFPPVVALLQRKQQAMKEGIRRYADVSLYKCRMEVCLFTAAGLLAYALDISGVGALIPGLIPGALIGRPYWLMIALMLLVIVPGQFGIHPVAVGTTLVATVSPAAIGLSVPAFGLTVICAWLLSNMLSPFSALNITLAGLSGKSTFTTGLKLNWLYALVCLFVYAGMILLLAPLLN